MPAFSPYVTSMFPGTSLKPSTSRRVPLHGLEARLDMSADREVDTPSVPFLDGLRHRDLDLD